MGIVWGRVQVFWQALGLAALQLVLPVSRVGVRWCSVLRSRHLAAAVVTGRRTGASCPGTGQSMYTRRCTHRRVDRTSCGARPSPLGATAGTPASASDVGLAAGHGLHHTGQAVQYGYRLLVADREGWEESYDVCGPATKFDDEATAQALHMDGGGEFGSTRAGAVRGPSLRNRVKPATPTPNSPSRPAFPRHELETDHHPSPPHIPHTRELMGQSSELGEHPHSEFGRASSEVALADVRGRRGAAWAMASWLPQNAAA